jgi:hypothetical protein
VENVVANRTVIQAHKAKPINVKHMEAENVVMNLIVIQVPKAKPINVKHMEAENDVMNLIVKKVQKASNEPDCHSSAFGKTDKCIAHGGGKRCNEPDCKSSAQGKSDKCIAHGGGKRCPNCIGWIDSRCGSVKYDGYCATCFKRIFPDDERSKIIYTHTKEIMVRNAINTNFEGFVHDRPLYTMNCDCSHRRRIDHRKLIDNTILAVETDEFGHRGYNQHDEEIRYDDLYMIHSGKWIFIRFNPDDNFSKVDIDDKLDKLIETMNDCILRVEREENTELLEIIKLYC